MEILVDNLAHEEKVRYSLQLARVKHQVKDIADALGCVQQTLSPFMTGDSLGPGLLQKAEAWARENGYWIWDQFSYVRPLVARESPEDYIAAPDPLLESADALELAEIALLFSLRSLRLESRDRATKARVVLKQIEDIHGQLGPELVKMFEPME